MRIAASEIDHDIVKSMSDENAGKLFKLLVYSVCYDANPLIVPGTPMDVLTAYTAFRSDITRANELSRIRSEAGKQGGRGNIKQNKAKESKIKQNEEEEKSKKKQNKAKESKTDSYISTEYCSNPLSDSSPKTIDTESYSSPLNDSIPKALDENTEDYSRDTKGSVLKDRVVESLWCEYVLKRRDAGKPLNMDDAEKMKALLEEKSGGNPDRAKGILQRSIDRIQIPTKPKNKTNNFFDMNERKPGDPGYEDLDKLVRSEL